MIEPFSLRINLALICELFKSNEADSSSSSKSSFQFHIIPSSQSAVKVTLPLQKESVFSVS
jgi:hypothetical protein